MKELIENLQGYIQTNIDLAKLEIHEKIEFFAKKAIYLIAFSLLVFLAIFFIFLALALFFGDLFGNYFWGFGLVAVFLVLVSLVLFLVFKSK